MRKIDDSTLFESLRTANWRLAARTFGSSHATLIGVLADWWFRLDPASHSILDGAPSYGKGNAGWCDLMLCTNTLPVGVVEVEGSKPVVKLETIKAYFSSSHPSLSGLDFGLLLVYAYYAKGRGKAKQYPPAETPEILAQARKVSATHPSKTLLLLALDKIVDPNPGILRATRAAYYLGSLARVGAVLLVGGEEVRRETLFEAS